MQTTRTTMLGFAAVICAAIALIPMLVETGRLSAAAAPETVEHGFRIAGAR
jgi:hypothetical protein